MSGYKEDYKKELEESNTKDKVYWIRDPLTNSIMNDILEEIQNLHNDIDDLKEEVKNLKAKVTYGEDKY